MLVLVIWGLIAWARFAPSALGLDRRDRRDGLAAAARVSARASSARDMAGTSARRPPRSGSTCTSTCAAMPPGSSAAGDELRRRSSAAQLAVIAAPRLRGLVAAMHGHHQIEDFQYFPAFRRAEPRSRAASTGSSASMWTCATASTPRSRRSPSCSAAAERSKPKPATLRFAAERYVDAAAALCSSLLRHLDDEEDLVVPLLIERGDDY